MTKHACLARPSALALPQIWQSSSILFRDSTMFQQSDVMDEPVPPVGLCRRDLNAEAYQPNCDFSGRGRPHCT